MKQYHKPHTKKVSSGTGGKRVKFRDKKLAHVGGVFTATKVADKDERVVSRGRGFNLKTKLKRAAFVNVKNKEGKMSKAKILGVLESHNPEYVRQNIITKGAVLNTEAGKVKVTNRVGQDGVVNGIVVG
ncbi:30S ribosomal protein S8e [Candidatus Micrarchaeota archaeon]|nr:30S ribosomal protein S8e [Candidatus Micrarchaeota archaeon]